MKAQNFFLPLMLIFSMNAADSTKPTVAQQYPFSDVDRELFYNFETQKMESPYSTASVKSFSNDTLDFFRNSNS